MSDLIILYRKNGSCSMVAHILLTEIGTPFRSVPLRAGPSGYEAADGSLSHTEYVQTINPTGYVPALSVRGEVITENPAILRYIANLAPERQLLGSTALGKARVDEWLAWLSTTLHGAVFGAFWRPTRFVDDHSDMHSAISAKGYKTILASLERINGRVGERFAVGSGLTVVDLYLHTFYRWGREIGVDMSQYPRYGVVMKGVNKLASVQKIMAEEGQVLDLSE